MKNAQVHRPTLSEHEVMMVSKVWNLQVRILRTSLKSNGVYKGLPLSQALSRGAGALLEDLPSSSLRVERVDT